MAIVSQDYVDQSLSDLRLLVGLGYLELENNEILVNGDKNSVLTVHEDLQFTYGDFTFHVYILGESHAVLVKYKGKIILYEIIACTDVKVKGVKSLLLNEFKDFVNHKTEVGDYIHEFKKNCMNLNQLSEMCDELSSKENATKLEHNFCMNEPCKCSVKPITMVAIEVVDDFVNIYSIHVYPNKEDSSRIAVYTKSTIYKK